MRILILGGTNFVGPYVVRQLAAQGLNLGQVHEEGHEQGHEQGHDITIFHRGVTETELPESVRHIHGDFRNFNTHLDELKRFSPEVVLDMAPFREEDADRVKAFAGVARRVVVISSQDVYRAYGRLWRTEPGPPDSVPLTEDSPLREKLSGEGLDYNKTAIERAVMNDRALPATILRLPATHGPGDDKHRLFPYIKRMDDGCPAILLDEAYACWRWSRGYVEDVAHAIVLAVTDERAAGRIYNVAYPETLSEAEWVNAITRVYNTVDAGVANWPGQVVALPAEQLPASLRREMFDFTQQYEVDSSRIRSELGYSEVVPFDEALRRTIAWERAHPPVEFEEIDYGAEDAALSTRN